MLAVRNFITGEEMSILDAMKGGMIVMTGNGEDPLERRKLLLAKIRSRELFFKQAFFITNLTFLLFGFILIVCAVLPMLGYGSSRTESMFSASCYMIVICIVTYGVLSIAKYLWKRKLEKQGFSLSKRY